MGFTDVTGSDFDGDEAALSQDPDLLKAMPIVEVAEASVARISRIARVLAEAHV